MKSKKQANQYDKIFKENIEAVIPSLMKNILGITAITSDEIPDDIQHTKERKPDFLKRITDEKGNIFVLQIEFQVLDEPDMVYRMAEYNIMLARKYKLPIEQFVIYLGLKKPKFSCQVESKLLKYQFPLITFSSLDYHLFLESDKPEEVILSILANFKKEDSESVLKKIIHRIEETTEGDFALKRYVRQLRILSQLRNLEQKLKEIIMDSITKYIDEERDVAFMIAKELEQTKFVTNLLHESDFSLEKIAKITGVTLDFVKKIQQKLNSEK